MFFFFFQAEDGIRDGRVTGVQTCALPILRGTAVDFRVEPAGLGVQRGGYANGDERQEYWAHGLKLANLRNASTGWAFSYLFSHTNILVPQLRVRADKLGHHADAGRVLTHLE